MSKELAPKFRGSERIFDAFRRSSTWVSWPLVIRRGCSRTGSTSTQGTSDWSGDNGGGRREGVPMLPNVLASHRHSTTGTRFFELGFLSNEATSDDPSEDKQEASRPLEQRKPENREKRDGEEHKGESEHIRQLRSRKFCIPSRSFIE